MWYTIKTADKSEWLSSLAQQYLGDWQKYMDIYNANKDVMTSPDVVYPGLTIWIPVGGEKKPSTISMEPEIQTFAPTGSGVITKTKQSNTLLFAGIAALGAFIFFVVAKR